MASRLELQTAYEKILESRNVYFDPPSSLNMAYPAIRYKLADIDTTHANNAVYSQSKAYETILIDEDPDTEYLDKLMKMPKCRFVRYYSADNLHHWVFTIYY